MRVTGGIALGMIKEATEFTEMRYVIGAGLRKNHPCGSIRFDSNSSPRADENSGAFPFQHRSGVLTAAPARPARCITAIQKREAAIFSFAAQGSRERLD
jgi:hypothetical protein